MRNSLIFLCIASCVTLATAADSVVLENRALRVEIAPDTGRIRVVEKAGGQAWEQPTPEPSTARREPMYRVLKQTKTSLEATRTFDAGKNLRVNLRLRFTLPGANAPELRVEASAEDSTKPCGYPRFIEPFVLDAPRGVLVVADYSNGHLYPLDLQPFPRGSFGGDRLDMPWVGLCDLDSGRGYLLLLETSDDCDVKMQKIAGKGGRALVAPQVTWRPQKEVFGYTRSLLFHFAAKGGYVALCKRYRAYAKERGLIVPFTEKLKKNPNLKRLFGAPDVWGDATLAFAREAKAAGVEKMLIHGKPAKPADMRAINDLGYLTSEYDNYTDILQAKDGKVDSSHAMLPDDAVLKNDQQRMTAWLTWDKKTQYMKRCPMLWVDAAKATAEKVLAEWPFIGRFIDVTTAEGMYECYDPKHPMTRTQKRECGPALHRVFRDRKLVMGGEHGIWWCVPVVDYIEGIQSGGYASWPAGHLIHPKTKDQEFEGAWGKLKTKWETYAQWGIGHESRAPLWELVFHDCIVSTWYWGDASDWLLDAAPEITPKKDAFNILYGTIPLLWANKEGSWRKDRAVFLRTYRNTCKLHETLATAELLSHEFVTADRAVQRTRFSDGTECVVNFGEKPYRAAFGGKACELPQNGWVVTGPKVQQSLALVDGKLVTTIRSPDYAFSDRGGVPVTLIAESEGRLRVTVGAATPRVSLRPADADRASKATTGVLYRCDAQGKPLDVMEFRAGAAGEIEFGPVAAPGSFLLLRGKGMQQPDLRVSDMQIEPAVPKQGGKLRVSATISNYGGIAVSGVPVDFCVDGRATSRAVVSLKPRAGTEVVAEVDTAAADGTRILSVVVEPSAKVKELSKQNNRAEQAVQVAADWSRWPHRKLLRVSAAGVARENAAVVVPFALPAEGDANSVRVAEAGTDGKPAKAVPAQLDRDKLCFIVPGDLAADVTRKFVVLWRDKSASPASLPPGGSFWRAAEQTIVPSGYEARFEHGTLTFLAARKDGVTGNNFLKSLILSSGETGWGSEDGTVEKFEVKHTGPVRTVIRVRKALKAGVVYEKQYAFYPERFDVEITVNKPAGCLYSRAHYLERGTYADNRGNTAVVDGHGDAENVYGRNAKPKWYAVFTPDWAHSCVALTPVESLAYWDAGSSWGSIGFHTSARQMSGIRISYVIHPGAKDAGFAGEDCRRLSKPPAAVWE
ncbi:MAG: glycoside hydrolase [Verrucomicrobiia bacterium]